MLTPPRAGVGRVDAEDRHLTPGSHGAQSVPEFPGGYPGDGAAEAFPALAAAHGFSAGRAGIDEIEILHHDRGAAVGMCVVEQGSDRGPHPAVTV